MPTPDNKRISWVDTGEIVASAAGDTEVRFRVISMEEPHEAAPNIMVYASVEAYEAGSPELSTDRTHWDSSAEIRSNTSGEASFYVRSGSNPGPFQLSGGIGDLVPPRHKAFVSGTARGSIASIAFDSPGELKTWQGELFVPPKPIHVATQPASKQAIQVQLSGPGGANDPDDHGAHFVGETRKVTLASGDALPKVRAGKSMGVVEIKATAGGKSAAPLHWRVLPLPDQLTLLGRSKIRNIGIQDPQDQISALHFLLTGHRILGDASTDSGQIVPIEGWPVQLRSDDLAVLKFQGDNTSADGGTLTVSSDHNGKVVMPRQQVTIGNSVLDKTVKLTAYWRAKPNNAGNWINPLLQNATLTIRFIE